MEAAGSLRATDRGPVADEVERLVEAAYRAGVADDTGRANRLLFEAEALVERQSP